MILVSRAQFFLSFEKHFYKTKDRSMSRLDAWPAADILQDKTNCRVIADKVIQSSHTFWPIGKQNVRNIAGKMSGDLMAYFKCLSPGLQLSSWHWKAIGRHWHRGQLGIVGNGHAHPCRIQMHVTAASDLESDTFFLLILPMMINI